MFYNRLFTRGKIVKVLLRHALASRVVAHYPTMCGHLPPLKSRGDRTRMHRDTASDAKLYLCSAFKSI